MSDTPGAQRLKVCVRCVDKVVEDLDAGRRSRESESERVCDVERVKERASERSRVVVVR